MLSQLPMIWRIGQSKASDQRLAEELNCAVKVIATHQTEDAAQAVSSAEFEDAWQNLMDSSFPDAIYIDHLPSNQLITSSSRWLKQVKALLPSVKVLVNTDCGGKVDCERFKAELLPYTDLFLVTRNRLCQLDKGFEQLAISEIQQALPNNENSSVTWLLQGDEGNWVFTDGQTMQFVSALPLQKPQQALLGQSLASFLAHGYDELDAITLAHAYLASVENGYSGWPKQVACLPNIHSIDGIDAEARSAEGFVSINLEKFGLYPVVDSIAWLKLVLENGVKTAQLRVKDPLSPTLDQDIQQAIALGKEFDAQVFINDYWQKAIEHGAFGVHLGQEDLAIADLEAIRNAGLALGISTHGYFEIAKAQRIQPSYIALGHIFPTQTKDMPSQPQGLTRLALYADLLKGVFPTVAIGGISADCVLPVLKTGVDSVALVTAITKADDPSQATQALLSLFQIGKEEACL